MLKHLILSLTLAAPLWAQAQYKSQVWSPDNGDGTYTNPVINADYSDPDVIAVGDDYYLTASSFNCIPGLPILHSKDLVNWELIGHAVDRLVPDSLFSGVPAHGNGVWAPSIRHHNGEFYIYWGDPDNGVFMVKAKNPAGPWEEPVLVIPGKGMIDTCPLWDDDGRCYLVNGWANSRNRFASVITVRELNAEGTKAIGNPTIVFDGNGTEYRTAEGPKFYKRDGWYWIMFPAGGVPTGFQVAMRSKSPFGPYEYMKVLDQGSTNINGPHQGGWVHTAQGEDWFMHFQDKGAYGRVVHLQPVTWKDNWPVMGRVPKKGYCGEPYTTFRKPKSASTRVVNPVESDEFNAPSLGLQWQWQANYDQAFGMPTSMGCFRLYTWKSDRTLWNTPNLLLQKTPADNFTATTKFKLVSKDQNQYGGIIVMGHNYQALVVKRVGEKFELQQIFCHDADKGTAETVKTLATLNRTGQDENNYQFAIHEEIYMRMTVAAGKAQFAYSTDGKSFKNVGDVFEMREGKWIGAKIGLVAQEPAGKTNRGWIDVDWFRVTK
jgi:beta-xylosidase